jgi:RNA polymerase sigma factor (sigma-70 family)
MATSEMKDQPAVSASANLSDPGNATAETNWRLEARSPAPVRPPLRSSPQTISAPRPGPRRGTLPIPEPYIGQVLALDRRKLRLWLYRITRDTQSLEDLSQEVYEQLLKIAPCTSASIRSLEGYAHGIAVHIGLDWLKRRRSSRIAYLGDIEELEVTHQQGEDPEKIEATYEQLQLLAAEVERLPHRSREVLTRVKILGHTVKEVSEQLGIEPSTVKNHLQIAAKRCDEALSRKSPRPGLVLLSWLLGKKECAYAFG